MQDNILRALWFGGVIAFCVGFESALTGQTNATCIDRILIAFLAGTAGHFAASLRYNKIVPA